MKSKQISRYQIGNQLGAGSMAMVYEAYDPSIDRQLAIKILHEDKCVDDEYVRRFLREAKAIGTLTHPNIVTVYDVGQFDNRPYIVMELLEGVPLNTLMRAGKQYPVAEVVSIGCQLASALDYAHRRGIVHRDVKPSNIISSPYENKVKITDFGIAHFTEIEEASQRTQMGDVLGTPFYMSPEQLEGVAIDGRSDLFSLGIILYQLVTGDRPFKGDSFPALMYQISTSKPKLIEDYVPDFPKSIVKIINKLLHKDPDKRYQTGNEIIEALNQSRDDIQDKTPVIAKKRTLPFAVKWGLIAASAVFLLSFIGTLISSSFQYKAVNSQLKTYGTSLSTFVAAESAAPIFSEDWVTMALFVKDAVERQQLDYLTILDLHGVVRASSISRQIGKPYAVATDSNSNDDGIFSNMWKIIVGSSEVADFSAPVIFQGNNIGRVHLGLSQKSIVTVTRTTLVMMMIFLLITLSVIIGFAYKLGNHYASSISVIKQAMQALIRGDSDYRIVQDAEDDIEFEALYNTFNQMAASIKLSQHSQQSQITSEQSEHGPATIVNTEIDSDSTVVSDPNSTVVSDSDSTVVSNPDSTVVSNNLP
jgi:serine/threonine protein kinase